MSQIDLAVFDLAGTIIQPDPPVEIQYESDARDLLPREYIPPRSIIRERFRVAFQTISPGSNGLYYGTTKTEGYQFWKRVVRAVFPTLGPELLERLTDRLYERFSSAENWTLLSGAVPVLRRLARQAVDVVLLSNWDRRGRNLVEDLELEQFVSKIYISSEVGMEKPDPRFFMQPIKDFDTQPEHALMVGNEPESDLEPARSIGMDTLLLIEGSTDTTGHLWDSVAHSWLDVANRLADVKQVSSDR